jgi:DNA-binding transcriptional LysR family regulator
VAAKRRVRATDLDGEAWIALPSAINPEWRQRFVRECAAAGFVPDIRFEATDPATVLGLVDGGIGIAFVQASIRRTAPDGVSFIPLPWLPLAVELHFVTRRNDRNPLVGMFCDALMPECGSRRVRS